MASQTVDAASAADAKAKPGGRPTGGKEKRSGWVLSFPFVALFLVFSAIPVIASFAMSFTDIRSTDIRTPFQVNFVGFRNYVDLFSDEVLRAATVNTLIFLVIGTPITLFLALIIAVGLNTGVRKLATFFRVGYYLPAITSIVAISVVWKYLYDPEVGIINTALGWFGITGPNWLQSTTWALPALIIMAIWRSLGTLSVIFLAGLQGVDRQMYEAAEVDGANAWQKFRYITVPAMRPTILFGAVITGIGFLQFFEEPFVMTQGGPLNHTMSVAYHAYNEFGFGNYGYSSAISYALFVAIVLLTIIQFRVLRPNT